MRLLNANANEHPLRIKLSAHIRTGIIMELQRNKVCGIDVHKRFLIATILSRDGKKDTQRFSVTLEDLLKFRDWVIENGCEQVAIESNHESRFAPKTMKTAATDRSIDMGSEGC